MYAFQASFLVGESGLVTDTMLTSGGEGRRLMQAPDQHGMACLAKALVGDVEAKQLIDQKVQILSDHDSVSVAQDHEPVSGEIVESAKGTTWVHTTDTEPVPLDTSHGIFGLRSTADFNKGGVSMLPRVTVHGGLNGKVINHKFGTCSGRKFTCVGS